MNPSEVVTESACPRALVPATAAFTKIYDPSVGETGPWYINDHSIIRATDGTWHMFGITHAEPANPGDERAFAHATASSLKSGWTKQAAVLPYDPGTGETVVWAPHVIYDSGTYYMFYSGGGADPKAFQMRLATSTNLSTWTRRATPLFTDGYEARDPFVIKVGQQWVMYYTATTNTTGGNHIVAYRTSTDLINWSARGVAFTDPSTGTGGGPTESPFVVERSGEYFLFLGPRSGYTGTDVFVSTDPLKFELADRVAHFGAHAAELVQDTDGKWYISGAGWGMAGVYLAPLEWATPKCYVAETAQYKATIQTSPHVALLSYQRKGDSELLGNGYHSTVPYISQGEFGNWSTNAGAAATVTVGGDKKQVLTLTGIPFGASRQKGAALPLTAEWSFCFEEDSFEHKLQWSLASTLTSVWEVGLNFETVFARLGDASNLNRTGDVAGFPAWILAGDTSHSVVNAYRSGSAFGEANAWFAPSEKRLAWQALWTNGGRTWNAGQHAGGRWRMGASATSNDTSLANALAAKPTCFP